MTLQGLLPQLVAHPSWSGAPEALHVCEWLAGRAGRCGRWLLAAA